MSRFGTLGTQYFDDAGDPLIDGLVHFFESGAGSTEKTTFADIGLKIPNTNPVVLTAAGRQPNIFFAGSAKAILATSADVQIEVRDPVGQATSEEAFAAWNALITYDLNDIVKGSDQLFYTSIGNANIGHDPTSTSGFWMEVRFINVWDAAYTYADGLFAVASDDNLYISRIDTNIGNDPVSSPTQWRLLSAGVPNGTVDGQMIRWEAATSEYQAVSDMVIDDAGDVGINIVAPESQLHVLREATSLAFFDRMGSGAGGPEIMGRRAKGTVGAPTAVQSGEELVEFKGAGHDGVAFTGGRASVTMVAAENFTPSAQGARMEFLTTPLGATADVLGMTIEENGDITADIGDFITTVGNVTAAGNVNVGSFLNVGVPVELTIASGVVTASQSNLIIDTEADAATDDLDTINAGTDGDLLWVRNADDARTVVLKNGTGNLRIGADFSLTNRADKVSLIYNGITAEWDMLARRDNA